MSKKLKEDPPVIPEVSEDDNTVTDNSKIAGVYMSHLYASIMVGLPNDKEAQQQDAPLAVLSRVNEMLKPLSNKFPDKIWIAPWSLQDEDITDAKLRQNVASNDDDDPLSIAEQYIHDFNRFQSWGRRSYMRIHLLHDPSIHKSQLLAQMDLCSIKGDAGQFFQQAHSHAKDPIAGGTLTGSVEEMAFSKDFAKTFQQRWKLKNLGLYWNFLRSKKKGTYTVSKSAIHIELDRSDEGKLEKIKDFFNQKSTNSTNQFWGTPMQWVQQWDYRIRDHVNDSIERNKDSQHKLGMNLRSCSIRGINLFNMLKDDSMKKTLHQKLMEIESIHDKYVEIHKDPDGKLLKTPTKKAFRGRLFYAIIPQSDTSTATFYYSQANAEEARSVARALPRFIQTNLGLQASHFCTTEFIAESKNGKWHQHSRLYLSEEDLIEKEKLEEIDQSMSAVKEIFIDPSQQRAFAADGASLDLTIDTRLTQGEATATPVRQSTDASTLTGDTRESKVKRAVLEVTKQFHKDREKEAIAQHTMQSELTRLREALAQAGIQFPNPLEPTMMQGEAQAVENPSIVDLQKDSEDESSNVGQDEEDELLEPHRRSQDYIPSQQIQNEPSVSESRALEHTNNEIGTDSDSDSSDEEMINATSPKPKQHSALSISSAGSDVSNISLPKVAMDASNSNESSSDTDEPTPGGPRGGTNQ